MIINGKNIFTCKQYVIYAKSIGMNNNDIGYNLREYWNCKNLEIAYYLEWYEEE